MQNTPIRLSVFSSLVSFLLPSVSFAMPHISDMPAQERKDELKISGFQSFTDEPENLGGFNELLPYILPSPDQDEAGSCLYMATTGIAEWWLARLNPAVSRTSEGPLDLSERYTMNLAGALDEGEVGLKNWRTDSIYLFNRNRSQALLNTAYRFTKGWYVGEQYSDKLEVATETTPGAQYGTYFNWIDERPSNPQGAVLLPVFERRVIFADPEENQWNIGTAPDDIVTKVKDALRTEKSPVLVIYNHNSWWHAVYVIGYNDDMDNGKCAYTERFRKVIANRAAELDGEAANATDPTSKSAYEIRAKRAHEAKDKIERVYATRGGCTSGKGVFYIRDSIYPDEKGIMYHYDLARKDTDAPYTKKIVFKEYDWLRYFSNNVTVVYPKKGLKVLENATSP